MAGYSHNDADLIPNMSDATTPSPFVASASGTYTTYYPWKAFDGSASSTDSWVVASTTPWLRIDFGLVSAKWCVMGYSLTIYNNTNEGPKNFKLQGSNDAIAWTDVDTRVNITWSATYQMQTFVCNSPSPVAFRYYQLNVSAVGSGSYTSLYEVEMWGQPARKCYLHARRDRMNMGGVSTQNQLG